MAGLALEFSVNLCFKELTHHDGGHGWTKSQGQGRGYYRWEKRRMAKLSRRNGVKIVAEYSTVVDLELQEQLQFVIAYLLFAETLAFGKVMVEFMRPMCSGPGNCNVCDNKE
jgi:hypothetical protein